MPLPKRSLNPGNNGPKKNDPNQLDAKKLELKKIEQLNHAVEAMLGVGLPVIAAPNAGLPRSVDERMVYVTTPEYFGVYARRMFKLPL